MRLLFTALACLLSVSLSAQEQVITYPYNPDADTDSLIAVPDMLDLLVLFGNEFIPEPVTVDGIVITEWLENNSSSSGGGGCDYQFPDGFHGSPITWHLPNNDYTVPSGKNLYITSFSGYSGGEKMKIDGLEIMDNQDFDQMIIAGAGSVVSTTSTQSSEWANFNGYLVDEDYFADCGGGGGSSDGEVNMSTNNLFNFLEEVRNGNSFLTNFIPDPIFYFSSSSENNLSLTVPEDKLMYILNLYHQNQANSGDDAIINGVNIGDISGSPRLLQAGDEMSFEYDSEYEDVVIQYVLIDNLFDLEISLFTSSSENNSSLIVPEDKLMYILNLYYQNQGNLGDDAIINGVNIGGISGSPRLLQAGDEMSFEYDSEYEDVIIQYVLIDID